MGKPDIIIAGKMGTGKTTAAQYLVNTYGYVMVSFADKLKEIAYDLFGAYIEEEEKPRDLLQNLGDGIRNICLHTYGDKDVWIKYLVNKIEKERGVQPIPYVIDDTRYKNELYTFMHTMGWTSLRMNVSPNARQRRYWDRYGKSFTKEQETFISEIDLDDELFNYDVNNNGTLIDLYRKLDFIVASSGERTVPTNLTI
jgi:Cdc6-like AAA superfamily ATPase